jgi:hypothetical protein
VPVTSDEAIEPAEFVRVIREALSHLPGSAYDLSFQPPSGEPEEWSIGLVSRLRPERTAQLRIVGQAGSNELDAYVGQGTHLEIQARGSWQPLGTDSPLSDVAALARTVVRGLIRERIWFVDNDVAKSRATLIVDGRKMKASSTYPVSRAGVKPVEISHEPY